MFRGRNSLDVLERHLLALPGSHGQDVHLQGGQPQRCVVLELRAEALQHHVVAALRQERERDETVKTLACRRKRSE